MKILHKIMLALTIIAIVGTIISAIYMIRYTDILKYEPNYLSYIYQKPASTIVPLLNEKVETCRLLTGVFGTLSALFAVATIFTKGERQC